MKFTSGIHDKAFAAVAEYVKVRGRVLKYVCHDIAKTHNQCHISVVPLLIIIVASN